MQLAWTRKVLATAAAVAFVGVMAVPGTAKDPLPEGGAAKQQDLDLAFLKTWVDKGVANPKEAQKSVDPVRTTALLLAQSAQNRFGGKDDEQLAGLRDQMIKISDALSDTDKLDWAAAAKALEAAKTAKGDKKPVKIHEAKEFGNETLMNVFKKSARGGRGWEDDLTEMAQGKKDIDAARVLEIAQGIHLVGQLAEQLPPDAKKKEWEKYAVEMQKVSKEAAEEALKKGAKPADLKKKLEAMEANCTACHKVFKK